MSQIHVIKRNGSTEELDINKIKKMVLWGCEDIKGVVPTDVEINAKLNWYDGISTTEIHSSLISSAESLISVDTPEYQYVASKLFSIQLRKTVWGGKTPPKLCDHIKFCVDAGVYDKSMLTEYDERELNKINDFLNHDRDYILTYGGIKQLEKKYFIQDRFTGQLFETPQFMYVGVAMFLFMRYPKHTRLKYVRKAYNEYSLLKVNLPTPTIAGARSPLKSFSSCCLIEVGDNKHEIFAASTATGLATMNRYGIGLNFGKMRGIGSKINNGEVIHPGVIPFLKVYESVVKASHQNGIRGGSASVNFPIWHLEILDILKLKDNAGTDNNRVRKLDYTIGMSKLFWQRWLDDKEITLFSPHDVPGLYDAFGHAEFDAMYLKYEADTTLQSRTRRVKMREVMTTFVEQRVQTGRYYILNVDHANTHTSWDVDVKMSNLCTEIVQPVTSFKDMNDDDGEIGICTLAAINVLEVKDHEFENTCDIIVRMLDELIDCQEYFCKAAENFAKKRRSLGVGITNFTAYLASRGCTVDSPEAPDIMNKLMERVQYYLLKSSLQLAKEKGRCEKFNETKYSKGILPIDTYAKIVDEFTDRSLQFDWEELRAEILEHGLRHSTLTAQMPCESSSTIQNATNGVEPVREVKIYKNSKTGSSPQIAPQFKTPYLLAFDMKDNSGYLKVAAAQQKWLDMAGSYNTYYNRAHYPDRLLPDSLVIKELLTAYKYGIISLYYLNTPDGNKHFAENKEERNEDIIDDQIQDCASGACTI